ncbi:VOC family protein [Rhizohabitans arisaemae]|uniref:VOC family protein n=1 Tax=Rhizohabitans arisaemae TaxID=2720610 RepID=UPI0024B0D23E|nr:VOC family protein [Rhizohabitans arisaemae]
MRFRSAFPMLACDDLQRSIAFYADGLGFQETFRFEDGGEPTFVALKLDDGSQLGLGVVPKGGSGIHGMPQRPIAGRFFELCVYCDDVDASVEFLRGLGHPVLVEPADTPWGERIAYVGDPDGHPVMVTAAKA